MKYVLFLTLAWCLACTVLLLAENQQSTTERKPQTSNGHSDEGKGDSATNYGAVDILSDTGGVDVHPYLDKILPLIRAKWYGLIPPPAQPPIMKKGKVTIAFHILKDGQITDMHLVDKSGDTALDWAAYGGITTASPLPAMPKDFGCRYLALRIEFYYNPGPGEVPPKHRTDSLVPCVTTEIKPVAVAVSPASAQVVRGEKQQFSAVITGELNSEVTWNVSGAGCSGSTCGSISSDGLYTAPSNIPSPPLVTVTATLATDPTEAANAKVMLVQPPTHP